MSRFTHLTDAEYRAVQCQMLAAEYAERARRLQFSMWRIDYAESVLWAERYARKARVLMGLEEFPDA